MKFTKAALAALMVVVAGRVQATTSATLTINVTFTQPSCNITVPASYDLGFLKPGERKNHSDLNITWECEGDTPRETALTAAIVTGTAENNDETVRLKVGPEDSMATLSLIEKNRSALIKLTGPKGGNYFCRDPNAVAGVTRTCTLTPVTEVSNPGVLGPASATLRFEVGYP
ncbi:F18 fimbrial protein FedE [Klebsiella quasipneumoniae]|uniref:F18 fimbrial protein FedE n=1 Tax=Klebsiella quasipneumoniae TaxID=1463165 RepID=UPI0029167F60|nr:F18 fimbrial protein FedE [Klebsiella quasipneumoniae]